MANNLFIVGTPYHLLTSYILNSTKYKNDTNYLALVHPHGYQDWHKSEILSFLASKKAGYQDIFPLITWLSRNSSKLTYPKQAKAVKQQLLPLHIDTAFLSGDADPQNHLLVSLLGLTSYYRFEDGMFSYYNEDRKRSKSHEYFHKLKLKLIRHLCSINTLLKLNTITTGASEVAIADLVYLPDLMMKSSPQLIEITREMIQEALSKLSEKITITSPLPPGKYALFLSQPITEQGKFNFEDEKKCLKIALNMLSKDQKLIYKPHPNDNPYKLEYVKTHFSNILINDSKDPVEVLLYFNPNIDKVFSYQSTTLIIAPKFTKKTVQCYSFVDFYHTPIVPAYREIMEKAGVIFVKP